MDAQEARKHRGLTIAALYKLSKNGECWFVPSQSTSERLYRVDPEKQTCTCPDHLEAGFVCKHIHAVKFTIQREYRPDGSMIETRTITTFTEKKVYRQNWPQYNLAATQEKHRFQILLHDLCRNVPNLPKPKRGPEPHSGHDSIFSMAFKVYSGFSSRRFHCDLLDAHERGYLQEPMPGMKVNQLMENGFFTPILSRLIEVSSLPLKTVETHFATDSSGFSTSRFLRWFDEKYGTHRTGREWVKAHICCGVKSNVITSVRILDKDANDCPQFAPLVGATASNFRIEAVSADKAYLSHGNLELVESLGGTPFVPFKSNSGDGGMEGAWGRMYGYFQFRREEFMSKYHLRSNVESTFSMVKAKFGDHVRSKTDTAMKNEVLCKFLCHNICCVILAQCELGIEPVFWGEQQAVNGRSRKHPASAPSLPVALA